MQRVIPVAVEGPQVPASPKKELPFGSVAVHKR
jgi:hypothetical protein